MNWNKLQEMQLALDNAILQAKPKMSAEERFNKTLVALSVEVAEVSNCSEHFKFWKDNKGKVDEKRFLDSYNSSGRKDGMYYDKNNKKMGLTRHEAHKLTLVEECSDALHFILSLANQSNIEIEYSWKVENIADTSPTLEEKIIDLNWLMHDSFENKRFNTNLVEFFFSYFKELGVTEQELEQAYYDKNKVNYERLREGY